MTCSKLAVTIAICGAIVGGASLAQAQQVVPVGRIFVIHTLPNGNCPSLDWDVLVGANNTLTGMVAWNDMESMARVTGHVTPSRAVSMTATEMGGQGRTATITGQVVANGNLTARISGPGIECPNVIFHVFRRSN